MFPSESAFEKRVYLSFSLLLIVLIVIISCRKIDDVSSRQRPSVNPETRFFTEHVPIDPLVKSILGFVKRENERYRFVSNLIKKIGYPYWDKAIIAGGKINARTVSDSTNTVFIPFVLDSSKMILQ